MFAAAPKTVTHAVSPLKVPRFCGVLSMRFINSAQSRKPRHFTLIGTAFFVSFRGQNWSFYFNIAAVKCLTSCYI